MTKARPGKPEPAAPTTRQVLPMELQVGDRFSEETGEWEVVGRPYTTAGGKNARVRVVTEVKLWGAYEKVSVKRA